MLVLLALLPTPHSLFAQEADNGKIIYEKWCVGCHGATGAGDGEAATSMLPRPRDFTGAIYQIRTTASGELPTDDDLRRVIDNGMPGTTMPAWRSRLSDNERDDVIAYLKSFSDFFEDEAPEPIAISKPPKVTDEGLAEGRQLYVEEVQCLKCHGDAGRGDGPSAPTMTDDAGFPIRPADLTENWKFNGGGSVEDIFLRMRTGLDGTPMPSNSDVIDAGILTEEQLWRVAQYVRSLSPEDAPNPSDVIRAALVEGVLPAGPEDSVWSGIAKFWIPLVGQIIQKPRWFAPTVDGIWAQAVHDGSSLALKLSWDDPSSSPSTDWEDYFQLVVQTMSDIDGAAPTEQGPDRVTVQFPLRSPEGTELPYFLGGDSRRPVYEWQWSSAPDQIAEGRATGLGTFTAYAASQVGHSASFEAGRWQLQITRSLVPEDSSVAPVLVPGEPIRIAFFVADGSNGEVGKRGSVSAWSSLYLDVPTPTRVYVAPVVAVLLTAGLGMVVVLRAQKHETGA
ncbi:MAG: c-type cytochrome [Gemmatimonadales bacterium]